MPMDIEFSEFTDLLSRASAKVSELYIQLPIAGREDPLFRERVYCYELYHCLRSEWPFEHLAFCGEVDKQRHPVIRGNGLNNLKPDYIVHSPGDMDSNLVVIEVKPATVANDELLSDLTHLTSFRRHGQYHHAVFYVYGGTTHQIESINRRAVRMARTDEFDRVSLARIIHEGRLKSLSSGRSELLGARGVTDDAMVGFAGLSYRDVGTAMSA